MSSRSRNIRIGDIMGTRKAFVWVFSVLVSTALAGSNENVMLTVDYDAFTEKSEECNQIISQKVLAAVRISGAVDLDGFSLKIQYDTSSYKFIKANPVQEDLTLFLHSSGGKTGPFFIREEKGLIDVASSIQGKDPALSPDGEGILVTLQFERLQGRDCRLIITEAELIDTELKLDKISVKDRRSE